MRTSIVVPTFNGQALIAQSVRTLLDYLAERGEASELIVVDDGSRDGSWSILERLARDEPRLRLVRNGVNRGKGHAVREGVRHARGERIVFTDCDLAYPCEDIGLILGALEDAEVAVANRVLPASRYIMSPSFFSYLYTRHLLSRGFNRLVKVLFGLPVGDCQAGLKGFRQGAAQRIFPRLTLNGFSFDVELLYIAKRQGLRVCEVPVRFHYSSEPTTVDFMRDSMRMARDLGHIGLNALRGRYANPS